MVPRLEETNAGVAQAVEIYSCGACNLFWFDNAASVRLTAKGVLGMFQFIGQAAGTPNTLASNHVCPRCTGALAFTHDLQRATHFTYWRCPRDRGQLMTFNQFLAEKNFIRPPSAAELEKLRATVRQITCSQCGAPIDLATDAACTHCGAPIALIDSEGVAKALQELAAGAAVTNGESVPAGTAARPAPQAMRTALSDAQIDALMDMQQKQDAARGHDLLAIGAAAISLAVGDWLLSR
jgi:hypothetical protein